MYTVVCAVMRSDFASRVHPPDVLLTRA